jgi:SAM-dependent methyltransferase
VIDVRLCPVCDSANRDFLFTARDVDYDFPGLYSLFRCKNCSLVYLGNPPGPRDLAEAYPGDYTEYHKGTKRRSLALVAKLLSVISAAGRPTYEHAPLSKPTNPGQAALDVGAGAGEGCTSLRSLGWNAFGVDFSKTSIREASRRGVTSVLGSAARPPFAESSFGFVLANNVLEHVYRPTEALKQWRGLLVVGGQVSIVVPNFDSIDQLLFREDWHGMLSVPRHLVHFNPRSLKLAMKLAGLTDIRVTDVPYPTFGGSILQSMGVNPKRLRQSGLLIAAGGAFSFLDLFSFSIGRGANLVATGRR